MGTALVSRHPHGGGLFSNVVMLKSPLLLEVTLHSYSC